MIQNSEIAQRLGYLRIPAGVQIRDSEIGELPRPGRAVLWPPDRRASRCRRCRESRSTTTATSRSARTTPSSLSARSIPGNEKAIGRVINHLARRGADVIHEGIKHVHVSGPRQRGRAEADAVAGAAALLRAGARRVPPAVAARADRRDASSPDASRGPRSCSPRTATCCTSTTPGARIAGKAPVGRVLIDDTRTGEVGDEVLRDRRHLAEDGLVVPVVAINKQTGALEGVPDIITRGFVMEDREALLADGARVITEVVEQASVEERTDQGLIKEKVARRAAALFPQAFGPASVRAARHHGDLTREGIDRFAPRQRVRRRRACLRRR